ncbi:bifunctional phosphopantothenoylcysteine decarboxylase/phosphopantothenate--cysteine ligase CoaBC [bacterium]|nr:bifunctional phosphopantothenoylcysteine decarboxylase/phosphopantothenate--cysteine ligase CoaBC [candidate division CSSED10-310 bacterium]
MPERNKFNLVLGITGGIAAYKSAEMTRILRNRGYEVQVIMTRNACEFIGPETLKALSGHPVITGMFDQHDNERQIGHIALADWADAAIIAPATANIIGKWANGIADDFLSTFLLAFSGPVLIAPAMNPKMFVNQAVQANLAVLVQRGVNVSGPDTGEVACGHVGTGRMSDPGVIADLAGAIIGRKRDLVGQRVLITAGPTREAIDPVRFISNRSSGKMGYAIAAAAAERGADVEVISGPVAVKPHAAVSRVEITTADQMGQAVMAASGQATIIIMTAAVSDWKPTITHPGKWKKGLSQTVSLELTQNDDILKRVANSRRANQIIIGFAAETENLDQEAKRKLQEKKLDAIVVNNVNQTGCGFDSDFNSGFILDRTGNVINIPVCSKREMAEIILDKCLKLLSEPGSSRGSDGISG